MKARSLQSLALPAVLALCFSTPALGQGMPAAPAAPVAPAVPAAPVAPALPSLTPVAPAPSAAPEVAAAPATAAPPAAAAPAPTLVSRLLSGPAKMPVHFAFIWQHSLGEGTFAVNPYARNPMYAWWISFRARYDLPYGFGVSARQDMDFEVTKSDSNTFVNQPLLGDSRLGIRNGYLKAPALGIGTSIYVGYRVPVSLESRFRRQLGSVDMGLSLDWSKWGVTLSAFALGVVHARAWGKPEADNMFVSQWFGTDNNSRALQDRSGQIIPTQKCIARASEAASGGCPMVGAANGSVASGLLWGSIGYDLSQFSIPLSFSVGVVGIQAISAYVGPQDQYTSGNAISGLTGNTLTWGLVSATYQFTDWMSLDVGIQSLQPFWSRDLGGKYPRFPLWNIPYWNMGNLGQYTGANNFSAFYTSITIAR